MFCKNMSQNSVFLVILLFGATILATEMPQLNEK